MSSVSKRKRSIMIIDDEIGIGETLQEHLSEEFERVEYYFDPIEAQNALVSREFSLILSDINMPKLIGPELIRFVRAQGILAPVIFLTGFANKENVLSAIRLGVSDVLEKPFDIGDLFKSIDRVFEIEKRKTQLILDNYHQESNLATLNKQKKMLGLLQAVNEKKKVG